MNDGRRQSNEPRGALRQPLVIREIGQQTTDLAHQQRGKERHEEGRAWIAQEQVGREDQE